MAIPKWLSSFTFHVARSAATALVIAAGLAVWAALKLYAADIQLGLPFAAVGGLLVFVAIVIAWNQLQQIDDRNQRKRLAQRSSAEIEKQIWEWLRKNNFAIQNEPDPKLADFRLNANNKVGVREHATIRIADIARPTDTLLLPFIFTRIATSTRQ